MVACSTVLMPFCFQFRLYSYIWRSFAVNSYICFPHPNNIQRKFGLTDINHKQVEIELLDLNLNYKAI